MAKYPNTLGRIEAAVCTEPAQFHSLSTNVTLSDTL